MVSARCAAANRTFLFHLQRPGRNQSDCDANRPKISPPAAGGRATGGRRVLVVKYARRLAACCAFVKTNLTHFDTRLVIYNAELASTRRFLPEPEGVSRIIGT